MGNPAVNGAFKGTLSELDRNFQLFMFDDTGAYSILWRMMFKLDGVNEVGL